MDNDILLNFFYKAITEDIIFEKIKIDTFYNHKPIKSKQITLKEINLTRSIIPIKLENNKTLLIDDFSINFFLSYTILIGENTQIIEFITNSNETYLCETNTFDIIKNKFDIKTTKFILAKELFKLKYTLPFTHTPIISDIKKYVSNQKHIDLEKIHIRKGNFIENFIPTIKANHVKIAKEMSLPVIPLIENNFIKTSKINIFDELTQNTILKPVFQYKVKTIREFDYDSNQLYKDTSKEFYLKLEPKILISKLGALKQTNLEEINKIILNNVKIKITSTVGEIQAPIWKTEKQNNLFKIKNKDEFEELTGIEFDNISNNLEDIYIQNEIGDLGVFQHKYLTKTLQKTLETIKKQNNLTYRTDVELLLKLIYSTQPQEISKIENLNPKEITKLQTKIMNLLNLTVTENTNNDKNKKENILITSYLSSMYSQLKELQNELNENKIKLLEIINKNLDIILNTLGTYKKEIKFDKNILISILHISIKLTEKLDKSTYQILKKEFAEYFKELNLITQSKINENIITLFKDINTLIKLSKTHKVCLYQKKKLNLTLPNVKILESKPKNSKYIKPNYTKLKEIFTYNYKEIALQIKQLNPKNIELSTLNLKNKQIKMQKDFYTNIEIYPDYKILASNEYFTLLLKRS